MQPKGLWSRIKSAFHMGQARQRNNTQRQQSGPCGRKHNWIWVVIGLFPSLKLRRSHQKIPPKGTKQMRGTVTGSAHQKLAFQLQNPSPGPNRGCSTPNCDLMLKAANAAQETCQENSLDSICGPISFIESPKSPHCSGWSASSTKPPGWLPNCYGALK